LEILKWTFEHGCPRNEDVCKNAALGGHFNKIFWARENGYTWDEDVCASAAKKEYFEALRAALKLARNIKMGQRKNCPWDE
jgi:hypothetical protein